MKALNLKATVNDQFEFEQLQGKSLDFISTGTDTFHIIKDGKSFKAEIVQFDASEKKLVIRVNGDPYEVKLADQYDQLVEKLGLGANNALAIKEVKAPMPGLVLKVLTESGCTVEKGDPLLILEAMKMENIIKAPGEGLITKIHVDTGAAVDKGQLLISMD